MLEHDAQHINRRYRQYEKVALCLFFAFVAINLLLIHYEVARSAKADPPPLGFPAAWKPDKKEYIAGSPIRFTYEIDTDEEGLLLQMIDAYENIRTHEIYPATNVSRVFDRAGHHVVRAMRTLPVTMETGTYRMRGWAKAETRIRSLPAPYVSEPFQVIGVD